MSEAVFDLDAELEAEAVTAPPTKRIENPMSACMYCKSRPPSI